jgi:phytanoyl-CoA hydroxylase
VHVHSDLWLDQPDAHDRIEERRAASVLSATEAEKLHGYVDDGYMTVPLGLDQEFCDTMDGEIASLWQQRPSDLAVSPAFGRPMSFPDYDGPVRARGYRIPDLHSHSAHARDLYLQPTLFRMVELIFDRPALAFQSLYFEYGSSQGLHRDPMFVATRPPLNMCAAWVALEDITADSGPLTYVPGSHRLPWYEFEPGTIACKESVPQPKRAEFAIWLQDIIREKGLEPRAFTCKRGDAFLWHGGLVHGGEVIKNTEQTRKSFVVHYTTAADYKSRTARMRVRENGTWQTVARTTETIVERNGARGLENPVRQAAEPGSAPGPEPARKGAGPQPAAGLTQFVERAKRWTSRRASRIRHR